MKYIWDEINRKWIEKPRRIAGGLQVIPDTHDPFKSMADGKIYDSKSRYRRSLPEGTVEIGSDNIEQKEFKPRSYVPDLLRAMEQDYSGTKYIQDVERTLRGSGARRNGR